MCRCVYTPSCLVVYSSSSKQRQEPMRLHDNQMSDLNTGNMRVK